jgi:hypothetical protein
MSYNLDTKTSISKENPILIHYLIRKLESRTNSLDKLKNILNSITTLEEYYTNKKPTINLIEDLIEDLKQAIFIIKALFTENKTLSLSNDTRQETIAKQISENIFSSNGNEDLRTSSNDIIKKYNSKSPKRELFNSNIPKAKQFSNTFRNIENDKIRLKNAVRLHFQYNRNSLEEKKNKTQSFDNNNMNGNTINSNELIMKIMNNAEILNLLNQRLGKDVIKKLTEPNCPKSYIEKVEMILNENVNIKDKYTNKLKVPMRIKNTIQAKINTPKMKKKYKSFSHRGNKNNENDKKFFDNNTNPYGGYFEKPKYLGNQKYYPISSKNS